MIQSVDLQEGELTLNHLKVQCTNLHLGGASEPYDPLQTYGNLRKGNEDMELRDILKYVSLEA